jgi:hypothetical protein
VNRPKRRRWGDRRWIEIKGSSNLGPQAVALEKKYGTCAAQEILALRVEAFRLRARIRDLGLVDIECDLAGGG